MEISKNNDLFNLLSRCTVRVTTVSSQGSGFFVAPGRILTCAHVVVPNESAAAGPAITVDWNFKSYEAEIKEVLPAPFPDLAILSVNIQEHPCVLLDPSCNPGDELYTYGYSESLKIIKAESVTGICEGWRHLEVRGTLQEFIKFKQANITSGLSGSALINLETGCVCGIVKSTRDETFDLGGFAVPTSVVYSEFSFLVEAQRQYHHGNQTWHESIRMLEYSPSTQLKKRHKLEADQISLSRMPITGHDLFGRDQELQLLDQAWSDENSNVLSVIAWGGVGKSTLINHWLRLMSQDQYRGAERVYAWSFYRQGTSGRIESADDFIASTLAWFGDTDPNKGSPWEKGERLAKLVRSARTLLVLDGLEPLQFPPGCQEGYFKDPALQVLVRELAGYNLGLCVITSRSQVADLDNFDDRVAPRLGLEHLSSSAGAQLLRALGVKGFQTELEQASEDFDGHCLALSLLGTYLKDAFAGDVTRRVEVLNLEQDTRPGKQARRVMASYEKWLGDGPEIAILRLMGFFDRPAEETAVASLKAAPPIPGLTDALQNLNRNTWQLILSKLRRAKLLAEVDSSNPKLLDSHPLVREYFGAQVKHNDVEAWREGCNRLYEYFKRRAKKQPETIQEMEPLFLAVAYGCNAGRHRDALHEVYLPRILRGDESYAARTLGARGKLLSVLSFFFEDGDWCRPIAQDLPGLQGLGPDDQLIVLTQAGLYLTATKGYGLPEVVSCYREVQQLCNTLGKTSLLYSVLIGQWRYSLVTDELQTSLQLAEEIHTLAQNQNDTALLLGAYRALANTTYFMGNFAVARAYAQQGISLWNSQRPQSSVEEVYTPIVTCLCIDAMVLWQFGNPDQAQLRIREAIDLATELSDMNALAVGFFIESYINQFRRNSHDTLMSSSRLIRLSTEQGFAFWLAAGNVLRGWALAIGGSTKEGIESLRQGLTDWRNTGAELSVPYFLAMEAEIFGRMGQTDEALSLLAEAESVAVKLDERWWLSEIYRLKGTMLSKKNETMTESESYFYRALDIAHGQGAKSLELRALFSLNQLLRKQGKKEEVLTSSTKQSITEENADLQSSNLFLSN
jgi:predicted ATPase